MANLKVIRKRIGSVKSTQKITRAMKMVASARLVKARLAITQLRPYALKTLDVLSSVASRAGDEDVHPMLAHREPKKVLLVVLTSDRGLAGAFNSSVCRAAHHRWDELAADGAEVSFAVIGRKGRDYFRRRGATILREFADVFKDLSVEKAGEIGRYLVGEYTAGGLKRLEAEERARQDVAPEGEEPEVEEDDEQEEDLEPHLDAVLIVYAQFKSAMTQEVVVEPLLPIVPMKADEEDSPAIDFIYEPSKRALLDRLLPMYVEIEVYRALLESVASEHGARMTAMDSATKNASDLVDRLTLQYNRARQAAITTELMEIISGAEALKG